LNPVLVEVTRADVVGFDGGTVTITLTCSAGFYVRSFAHALGQAVGTGAFLEALQRTRSGEFRLDEAMTLTEMCGDAEAPAARDGSREAILDWLIPLERLLTSFPAVVVTEGGRLWVGHGRELGPGQYRPATPAPIDNDHTTNREPSWVRVTDTEGHLLALATPGGTSGSLHPSVVLN